MLGPLLEVELIENCMPLWREAPFEVKMLLTPCVCISFRCPIVIFRGRRKGFCALPKSEQNVGVLRQSRKRWQAGHLKRICKDAFRLAGAVQETCSSEMLGGQVRALIS
jgi:hypothetical protein